MSIWGNPILIGGGGGGSPHGYASDAFDLAELMEEELTWDNTATEQE